MDAARVLYSGGLMDGKRTLGRLGFDAYGNEPGVAGPWKTFDGRDMPRWDALHGEAGELTKRRWEVNAAAVLTEARKYLLAGEDPPGLRWDPLACKYVQDVVRTGRAINPKLTGA